MFVLNVKNNYAKLEEPMNGTFLLNHFSCENSFYNVTAPFNTFSVVYQGQSSQTITLTPGFYDPYQLRDELNTQLSALSIQPSLIVCSYDITSHTFTFATTTQFSLDFSQTRTQDFLGFNDATTGQAISHTSVKPLVLNHKTVLILRIYEGNSNLQGTDGISGTFFLSDKDTVFGGVFFNEARNQTFRINHTNTMTFQLFDSEMNALSQTDFTLVFTKFH